MPKIHKAAMNNIKLVALLCVAGAVILAFGLSQSSAFVGSQAATNTPVAVHHEVPPPNSAAQAIVDEYTVSNPPREDPPVNAAHEAAGKTPVSVADAES